MAGGFIGTPSNLRWFESIWSASQQGATTAEVWQALREAAEATGSSLEGLTIQDVNEMRAMAGGLNAAMANLERADPGDVITSDMIGRFPSAITGPGSDMADIYRVRVGYTALDAAGNPFSDWSSLFLSGPLTTKADLMARAQTEVGANLASEDYGDEVQTLLSVDSVSVEYA